MKKIAIIGGNGLLGKELVNTYEKKYKVISINRDNYDLKKGAKQDVVINANGNSRRFWANQNIVNDFERSTFSVIKSIYDFPCERYIYISSSDVYPDQSNIRFTCEESEIDEKKLCAYGFHKHLAEKIVKRYCHDYLIIRPSLMLGNPLKKGPIYDILNNQPLYISPDSRIQMITIKTIATIIDMLLDKDIKNETFNIGGKGVVSFRTMGQYFNKEIVYSKEGTEQIYQMNVNKIGRLFPLKTSTDFLTNYLAGLKNSI